MPGTLHSLLAPVLDALHRDDAVGFHGRTGPLVEAAQRASADDLTAAIEELAPVLPRVFGWGSMLAVLSGALVEWGGSPVPLAEVLPARVADALHAYRLVQRIWSREGGGRPLPAQDLRSTGELARVLDPAARTLGLSELQTRQLRYAWSDLDNWLKPMCTVLMRREFRDAMSGREELRVAAAALAAEVEAAYWVESLCLMLDDAALLALDPPSGRGFRLTMAEIGDNYALHTLLGARLVNDQTRPLGYQPIEPAWLRAATDGEPFLPADATTIRRFRLFDVRGSHLSPHARPAEIPVTDGLRVVVLHPPLGVYRWTPGRIYTATCPTLTVVEELASGEAAHWLSRVAPANETDLLAKHPRASSG